MKPTYLVYWILILAMGIFNTYAGFKDASLASLFIGGMLLGMFYQASVRYLNDILDRRIKKVKDGKQP